jgi:hypothetical protein
MGTLTDQFWPTRHLHELPSPDEDLFGLSLLRPMIRKLHLIEFLEKLLEISPNIVAQHRLLPEILDHLGTRHFRGFKPKTRTQVILQRPGNSEIMGFKLPRLPKSLAFKI